MYEKLKSGRKKIGSLFYRGGIFHPTKSYSKLMDQFASYTGKKIINIGSGGHDQIKSAINIDPYRAGPNTIKAFGEDMPFEDQSIDVALCLAVLEHVKEPEKIVEEIGRVLKKGGEIYIEVPFLQPFHAAPGDYQRWTLNGLRFLLRDFKEVDAGVAGGPGSTIAWILVETSQVVFSNAFLQRLSKNLTKIAVFPLKYFDIFLIKKKGASNVASAIYFYGVKN